MAGIKDVIDKIKKMSDLNSNNLKPEDYAVPGGDADIVAKAIRKVKTAQIRKFFNKLKNLHQQAKRGRKIDEVKIEILKLMPELAYAKGRNVITDDFYKLMKACLLKEGEGNKQQCKINSFPEFDNFMSFLEAIVAYHKVHSK